MEVTIEKMTDERIMREACEMTFLGKSNMSLKRMYACEHSPCRTQVFWIRLYDIPLFCSTQLLRHHVGSQPFQLTCREDRKGGNVKLKVRIQSIIDAIDDGDKDKAIDELIWVSENTDRYTKVNLGLFINAQSLINMAKERLCSDASAETREIFKAIKTEIEKIDPDLAQFLVPRCIYRGGICNSLKPCGFNKTELFSKQLNQYQLLFI